MPVTQGAPIGVWLPARSAARRAATYRSRTPAAIPSDRQQAHADRDAARLGGERSGAWPAAVRAPDVRHNLVAEADGWRLRALCAVADVRRGDRSFGHGICVTASATWDVHYNAPDTRHCMVPSSGCAARTSSESTPSPGETGMGSPRPSSWPQARETWLARRVMSERPEVTYDAVFDPHDFVGGDGLRLARSRRTARRPRERPRKASRSSSTSSSCSSMFPAKRASLTRCWARA